jgi:hypothetical protein
MRLVSPLPPQPAFRFRLLDSNTWFEGQVEELSEDSLAFLSDLPLEIGTYVEIALSDAVQRAAGMQAPTSYVRVVYRVLDRWPDLRTAVVAGFVREPAEQVSGAA